MKGPRNISQFQNQMSRRQKAQNPHQTTQYFSNGQIPYESRNPSCLKQHTIPMIQSLADQNETIKQQRQRLLKQMKILNYLTKDLLFQNQKLRKHFNIRTQDVAKLVFTIQNNVQQDISDHKHLAHLLKQSNCFLVKQIQHIRKQEEYLLSESQILTHDLTALNQRNFQNQQNILNKVQAKIKNSYNSEIAAKIQLSAEDLIKKESNLIKEVNQLTQETAILQRSLKKISICSSETIQANRKDKSLYCQQIALCLSNLAKLKQQKNGLQNTVHNQKRVNDQLEANHRKLNDKLLSLVKKREKMALDFDQLINICKRATIQSAQSKTRTHQAEISLHKKTQQKQQLQANIKNLKYKIRQNEKKENELKNKLRNQNKKEVMMVRERLRGTQKNAQGQILSMRNEGQSIQLQIEDAKKQYASLDDDIKSYQDVVNGLQNPIQQIEKINLTLRLGREPLRYRN